MLRYNYAIAIFPRVDNQHWIMSVKRSVECDTRLPFLPKLLTLYSYPSLQLCAFLSLKQGNHRAGTYNGVSDSKEMY